MSSLSLDAAIRTCKVQAGEASRMESDRFLNRDSMACHKWHGHNSKGQAVHANSFYTKAPGCNPASDRVSVETVLRPNYAAYVNLDMAGLQGDHRNKMATAESLDAHRYHQSRNNISGRFGNQTRATNRMSCANNSYERAMAQAAEQQRGRVYAKNARNSQKYKKLGGEHA